MNNTAEACSKLISSNTVREMLADISIVTLRRWSTNKNYSSLNFPKPIKIATRNYWRLSDIENWVDEQQKHLLDSNT